MKNASKQAQNQWKSPKIFLGYTPADNQPSQLLFKSIAFVLSYKNF